VAENVECLCHALEPLFGIRPLIAGKTIRVIFQGQSAKRLPNILVGRIPLDT
jgi:hypothetical protein